jgi:hypothetical protein
MITNFKQFILKEIAFYWIIASFILFTIIFLLELNLTFKILSITSALLAKTIFDRQCKKYYTKEFIINNKRVFDLK